MDLRSRGAGSSADEDWVVTARALRVFRDMSSLAPESDLRTAIERQMERSAWLILLLSPEAAASKRHRSTRGSSGT
jgi:hypothetical protein